MFHIQQFYIDVLLIMQQTPTSDEVKDVPISTGTVRCGENNGLFDPVETPALVEKKNEKKQTIERERLTEKKRETNINCL